VDESVPPPLSWRVWFLLPLAGLGVFGLAVPIWRLEIQPRLAQTSPPPGEVRMPYRGELLAVLGRTDLDIEVLREIRDFHERLEREQAQHGGITRSHAEQVRSAVAKYGGTKPR
jgi:hypothetical protein